MVKAAASGGVPRASRLDRRKARTRQAHQLTEACLRLLGVPGPEAARLVASCLPLSGRSAGDLDLIDDGHDGMSLAFLSAHLLPRLTADCRRISPGA